MSEKCHKRKSPASFYHFVGAAEQRRGNDEVDCLRRLGVDDQQRFPFRGDLALCQTVFCLVRKSFAATIGEQPECIFS